ncbi:GNAT family N-acetyltransferase [Kitasatospora purpeofusca]|uniref:GNAT family N-acetyltransferase n=1 Tax=Kitasatospora purpeofusca TaxID=67352 RepID=UPI0038027016
MCTGSPVSPLLATGPAGGLTAGSFRARLASGEYRPDPTWIAEPDSAGPADTPHDLAVWWGDPGHVHPGALDGLYVHDAAPAGPTAPPWPPTCSPSPTPPTPGPARTPRRLPPHPPRRLARAARHPRRRRLAPEARPPRRPHRPPGTPPLRVDPAGRPPGPSTRLRFTPEPDDEVSVDLFCQVLAGSLDTASRAEADRVGDEAQAREDVVFYRDTMLGDRTWWRVARTPAGGDPVGFGLPSRNHASPVVGYLGVLPAHRGHGYATDILAEITRLIATETTPAPAHIRADTDLTNTPMSTALTRLQYHNTTRRLILSSP